MVAHYVDESLAQFRRWMADHHPDVTPPKMTRQHVEQYLAEIASTRSASPAQTRYKALRLFFAWALEEGEVEHQPTAEGMAETFGTDAPDGVRVVVASRIDKFDSG